jgi:hypothetical protein
VSVTIVCACGKRLLVREEQAGQLGKCPVCGQEIDTPALGQQDLLPPVSDPGPPADPWSDLSLDPVISPAAVEEVASPLAFLNEASKGEVRAAYRSRQYSPRAVAAAGLLGGPLAGCLLLAANYRRLGRKGAAWFFVLVGILASGGIFAALWEYADCPPRLGAVLYLGPLFLAQLVGSAVVFGLLAWLLQRKSFLAYLSQGRKAAPFQAVAGLCLLCSAILFVLQTLATYPITWNGTGRSLQFGPDEHLYYTDGVSRDQAVRLGKKLQEVGVLDGEGKKDVVVEKEGDRFLVRFFLSGDAVLEPWVRLYFEEMREQLAREVFAGAPLEILLCNQFNRPLRRIGERPQERDVLGPRDLPDGD